MITKGLFKTTDGFLGQQKLELESLVEIHRVVYDFLGEPSVSGCVGDDGFTITRDFGTVIVTSDIHADLLKFIQMLLSAGLVKCEDYEIRTPDDVYRAVWWIEWVAHETLLVITGDLVDGRRVTGMQVTDKHGSYEMLLHILLFNLRIGARTKGSDLLFTIGNHDLRSILLPDQHEGWKIYTAPEHIEFAPTDVADTPWECRAYMLAPFYLCSPYLMLRLGSALFMHGGLLDDLGKGDCVYRLALHAQANINAAMPNLPEVRAALVKYKEASDAQGCMYITDARGYVENDRADVCKDEATTSLTALGVSLVVVGHCVTHHYPHIVRDPECKAKDIDGTKDSEVGCIAQYACKGGPRIVLVDIGLSECFRGPEHNQGSNANRQTEMLKMELGHESDGA